MYANKDLTRLMKAIKSLCYKYEGHCMPMMAVVRAKAKLYNYPQEMLGDAKFLD